MKRYIDADALKLEIKRHIELMENTSTRYANARIDEANEVLSVIEALAGGEEAEIGYWNQTGLSIRMDKSLMSLGYKEGDKVLVQILKAS